MYAISAIGKRWTACYVLKGESSEYGKPVKGIAKVSSLRSPDQECWDPDITSEASWAALQSIVEEIKGYIGSGGNNEPDENDAEDGTSAGSVGTKRKATGKGRKRKIKVTAVLV